MKFYFTDSSMFGLDFESSFSYNRREYNTLREFIQHNGMDRKLLKKILLRRLESNPKLLKHFKCTDATYYHISQQAKDKLTNYTNYILSVDDFCLDNILGELYTEIYNKLYLSKEKSPMVTVNNTLRARSHFGLYGFYYNGYSLHNKIPTY